MQGMSIQQRYDDIVARSGLSEDIVRRVLKSSRESIAETLRQGCRVTLPGICTITPELKCKLNVYTQDLEYYVKLKAKPSNALETELHKISQFEETDEKSIKEQYDMEQQRLKNITFISDSSDGFGEMQAGVRTNQISALI